MLGLGEARGPDSHSCPLCARTIHCPRQVTTETIKSERPSVNPVGGSGVHAQASKGQQGSTREGGYSQISSLRHHLGERGREATTTQRSQRAYCLCNTRNNKVHGHGESQARKQQQRFGQRGGWGVNVMRVLAGFGPQREQVPRPVGNRAAASSRWADRKLRARYTSALEVLHNGGGVKIARR